MESYDPMQNPDPAQWLALDEDERIFLVEEFHEREKVDLPNVRLHASFHAVVETQLASGDPPQAVDTFARLLGEGLDRHDALHAIGSILSELMYHATKNPAENSDPTQAYIEGLKNLTVEKWLTCGDGVEE